MGTSKGVKMVHTVVELKPDIVVNRSDMAKLMVAARRMLRSADKHGNNELGCFAEGFLQSLRVISRDGKAKNESC